MGSAIERLLREYNRVLKKISLDKLIELNKNEAKIDLEEFMKDRRNVRLVP